MKTMWRGITIIIVAAVLSEVVSVGTYYYIKYAVSWRMSEQTSKNLKELERINNMKARVESAVMATVTAVEEKIEDPKELYRICAKLVDRNPHIIGSAVALAPEFCSKDETAFAAFAYQVADGSAVMTKQLPYDYQHSEWYAHSVEKDTAWWSEPYKDTGGSDMLIYTFSAPIHNQRHECIGVLTGDIDYKEMVFQRPGEETEFGRLFMWIFFSQIVSIVLIVFIVWRSTKSIRLLNKVTAVQDVMTRELQIASNIQSSMLPVTPNQENMRHQVDVKVKLLSANDISADFYDYLYVGHSMVFCLGDVPGSSVRASIVMAITRSVFRTAAMSISNADGVPSAVAIIKAMNRSLYSFNESGMFTTMFVGVLNLDTAKLTYCNAGHPWPVMLSPNGDLRPFELKPNVPVGILEDYDYEELHVTLTKGSTLFLYTDGLYETENYRHEVFGQKRMMARLAKSAESNESPQKVIDRMVTAVEDFRGNTPRRDDAVMVAIRTL